MQTRGKKVYAAITLAVITLSIAIVALGAEPDAVTNKQTVNWLVGALGFLVAAVASTYALFIRSEIKEARRIADKALDQATKTNDALNLLGLRLAGEYHDKEELLELIRLTIRAEVSPLCAEISELRRNNK